MLHNLILSVFSTTANDVRLPRGLLNGNSILTDVLEPDVVEVARTEAVDTFSLVGTDDDIP